MQGSGYMDRRESLRLDMEKHLIEISWTENSATVTRSVMCFDVSGGGLQIEMDKPLPLNTQVNVQFQPSESASKLFEAQIIRVIRTENGWFNMGLEFINKPQKQPGGSL